MASMIIFHEAFNPPSHILFIVCIQNRNNMYSIYTYILYVYICVYIMCVCNNIYIICILYLYTYNISCCTCKRILANDMFRAYQTRHGCQAARHFGSILRTKKSNGQVSSVSFPANTQSCTCIAW